MLASPLSIFSRGVRRIGMDCKFDLPELESIFSNNFSSHVYAILAEEYLKQNDLSRAYTVAKIGQENYPDDLVGKYILAKIYLLKNKIKKATHLLEEILRTFPLHLNARKLLIEIFKKQNDAKELDYQIVQLQRYFPNQAALKDNKTEPEIDSEDVPSNKEGVVEVSPKKSDLSFNKNMATFTFVDILIAQKHFSDALKVLDILDKKGRSADRITIKRSEIEEKMEK